jgi:type I restriction enzyme, S subunit
MAGETVGMCPTVDILPDDWRVKRLDSFCTKIGTGATPRGGSEVYLTSRVSHALVRSQHVFDRYFDTAGLAFISQEHAQELRNAEVQPGDVLLNITGDGVTFGRSCIVPDRVLPACVNQHVSIIRPDPRECDPGYLLSVLTHPATKGYIESFNSGGSRRAITKAHIESFEIPIPPLAEQKAIAAVLGALDHKIELNRQMNATLEAMARALFQSWFVDFDPVRAKLDGRQPPNLDPATAALFPSSFQDSPIGHIPTGWEAAELGQIADVIDCLHAKKPERCEQGQLYLQLNNIRDDGLIDVTDSFFVGAEDYQKWISRMEAVAGDCVITNVGRVGAVGQIPEGVKAALGRNITGIRCKAEFPFPTFLIECLVSESMREEIRLKTDSGTILDALNVKSIPKLRFARPSREIGAHFEVLTRPLRRRMEQNISESRTLGTLRDTLLPKLLSGELRVAEMRDLSQAAD